MEFSICLFNQRNPVLRDSLGPIALLLRHTLSIDRSLGVWINWNGRINKHILPFTILEESEHEEAILEGIIWMSDEDVMEEFRPGGNHGQGAQEPSIIQLSFLDVSRPAVIDEELGYLILLPSLEVFLV
jgi:hypothetical protein